MSDELGRGWATVDLARAEAELRHLLAPGRRFEDAPRSDWLGARCRVGRTADPEPRSLVVMEPDTEGRLAGFLARHGEGWAATYEIDDRPTGRWRPGPLGPEELAPDRPPDAGFLLLVASRTIQP